MIQTSPTIIAIVPAAGLGRRMKTERPKQYLLIHDKTVLEHTVNKLLRHPKIAKVIVVLSDKDPYYPHLSIADNKCVISVLGGKERFESVLSGLTYVRENEKADWVMVHDAARPCVNDRDIDKLIKVSLNHQVGGLLASPVRDTMKRANSLGNIEYTVDRENLWHALTPQMFRTEQLNTALNKALSEGVNVTDEASAMEWIGLSPALVQGSAENIKITQPEDLALAEFYLNQTRDNS
ncbi:2-C-methyl-D-erythritol 4-phosphate cytidylyltransferase [Vibrio pectenicida]|uniref:2-C-methyl-D-erythritol 4-phosphate cytidylyltransferase n=1 Tax=Vibrio pectenicida TaxID=62763 RepID=A0A7Y4ED56_9VIBR|nr:2-C-methyl-D-erythritol 4-phosphate cytidylyltransferase [Vibrio pectenicida]NOH70101.1 2-C-methyl-D-erythritol 4-phosphate cytidylyltransferase [Vibrio pectenicida]